MSNRQVKYLLFVIVFIVKQILFHRAVTFPTDHHFIPTEYNPAQDAFFFFWRCLHALDSKQSFCATSVRWLCGGCHSFPDNCTVFETLKAASPCGEESSQVSGRPTQPRGPPPLPRSPLRPSRSPTTCGTTSTSSTTCSASRWTSTPARSHTSRPRSSRRTCPGWPFSQIPLKSFSRRLYLICMSIFFKSFYNKQWAFEDFLSNGSLL